MTTKTHTGTGAICVNTGGFTEWESENMRSEDGGIYGIPGGYYEVKLDGETIGEVSAGEYKATEKQRRTRSNARWWMATKDGKQIGPFIKSRTAAVQLLVDAAAEGQQEEVLAEEAAAPEMNETSATLIISTLERKIVNLEYHLANRGEEKTQDLQDMKNALAAFKQMVGK